MRISKGGAGAKSYFFSGLLRGDSFADAEGKDADFQERTGTWFGVGARYLGLSGPVDKRPFCQLCDNINPMTMERLTLRNDVDRRAAYDFVFSVPKGYSYAALVMQDERLLGIARQAIQETLAEIERDVCTRVRKNGEVAERVTSNLVGALFEHYTSRPVGDHLPDMQLHIHASVFNSTLDPIEASWKALELDAVCRALPYYEALFHSKLAKGARECGYGIQTKGRFWDIADIPEPVVAYFSKRTQWVHDYAKANGIDRPEDLDKVGQRTRRAKAPRYTMSELREQWRKETAEVMGPNWKLPVPPRGRVVLPLEADALRASVRSVIAVAFEHHSTISEQRLVEAVLRRNFGRVEPGHIRELLPELGIIVKNVGGRRTATSAEVLKEEKTIVEIVRRGKGQYLTSNKAVELPERLTTNQRDAIEHVLRSTDRVTVIDGFAGTGKSEMLSNLVPALNGKVRHAMRNMLKHGRTPIESVAAKYAGDKVVLLAPTVQASKGRLREAGFKNADTVAQFFVSEELQSIARNGYVVLDEAGQIGTKNALKLLQLSESLGFRLVALGDHLQTRAPLRGGFMELLVGHAAVETAQMKQIVRQKGEMLDVATALQDGKVSKAFNLLEKNQRVSVGPADTMRQAVAKLYVEREQEGTRPTVMVPTHDEIAKLTKDIREARKSVDKIRREGTYRQYVPVESETAGRGQQEFYRRGMVVRFHRPLSTFRPGERAVVLSSTLGRLVVYNIRNGLRSVKLEDYGSWVAYEKQTIKIGVGDVLRVTANTRVYTTAELKWKAAAETAGMTDHRFRFPKHVLNSGDSVVVKGFTVRGDFITTSGYVVPKKFGHIEHGYCETIHSTQSQTFDRAILWAPEDSLGAMNQKSFTTAATRASTLFEVFTDELSQLREAISRPDSAMNAMDLEKGYPDATDREQEKRESAGMAEDLAREFEGRTEHEDFEAEFEEDIDREAEFEHEHWEKEHDE